MTDTGATGQANLRADGVGRTCDHPDCDEAGDHRAPRSPDDLDHYYWFCMEHVRSYNATWNYFSDMSQSEIEDYQKANFTWHRPTWRLGANRRAAGNTRFETAWRRGDGQDADGMFGEDGGGDGGPQHYMPPGERQALAVMNLTATATAIDIKARYKELVKRLHPDVNGDDPKALDRLKVVIEAYRTLSRKSSA